MLETAQDVLAYLDIAAIWIGRTALTVWLAVIVWLIIKVINCIRFDRAQRRKDEEDWLATVRKLNAELRMDKSERKVANQPTGPLQRDELDMYLDDWAGVLGIPSPRNPKMKENTQ